MALAKRIIERFDHEFDLQHFDYHAPGAAAAVLPRCASASPIR